MDKAHKIMIALLGVIVVILLAGALMMVKHHKYSGKGYGKGGSKGQAMMRMDTNDDGAISRDEFVTKTMERFDKLDADGDGMITRDEMKAARKGKGKGKKGKRDK